MSAEAATVPAASPGPSLGPPLGHEHVVRGLWRAARAGRLPHALLFLGPEGVGKFHAARWFTLGLYCAQGVPVDDGVPCGRCGPCKRVLAGSHPDVFVVEADEGEEHLKLERFVPRERGPRSVQEFLSLRAAECGRRVVLVREMERTRDTQDAVQNALLKMLEEPGQDVVWVLETSRPESLLITIKSRCVPVRFAPLEPRETSAVLAGAGLSGERAGRLARWSRGSPGIALGLRSAGAEGLVEAIEGVLAGAPPVLSARAVWELEGDFPGKTARAQQRARARAALGLALDVVADRLRRLAGADPEALAHPGPEGAGPDEPALRRVLTRLLESRRDVDRNLDPQAVLDLAFAALGSLAPRGGGRRTAGGTR